jgi:hypothetical protein
VLNSAIFCAEMAPDYQTDGKFQESQNNYTRFSQISAGKPSGWGKGGRTGEIREYLFGSLFPHLGYR